MKVIKKASALLLSLVMTLGVMAAFPPLAAMAEAGSHEVYRDDIPDWGDWFAWTNNGIDGLRAEYAGNQFSYTFSGTGFDVYNNNGWCNRLEIQLDGVEMFEGNCNDNRGLFYSSGVLPQGVYTITLVSREGAAAFEKFVIYGEGGAVTVPVESIAVLGAAGRDYIDVKGGTLQLAASVAPANASNRTVTWSVTSGAAGATISSSGLLTAVADGAVTVRATANDGSGVYGEKVITVTNQSGSVNPGDGVPIYRADIPDWGDWFAWTNNGIDGLRAEYDGNQFSYTFSGTGFDVYNNNGWCQDLEVLLNGTSVYLGNCNDNRGLYYSSGVLPNGVYTITLVARHGAAAFEKFVIYGGSGAVTVPVENIAVLGAADSDYINVKGGTLQLAASVTPSNASNRSVSWSVTSGAASASISSSGLLTAKADGVVTVRATANDGSGVYGEKVITVTNQSAGAQLDPGKLYISQSTVNTGDTVIFSWAATSSAPVQYIYVKYAPGFVPGSNAYGNDGEGYLYSSGTDYIEYANPVSTNDGISSMSAALDMQSGKYVFELWGSDGNVLDAVSDAVTVISGANPDVYENYKSLKLTFSGPPTYGMTLWQQVAVEANTDYVLSAWIKGDADFALRANYGEWYDGGTTVAYSDPGCRAGAEWQQYTLEFNSGSHTSLKVGVYPNGLAATPADGSFKLYLDKFELVKKDTSANLLQNPGFESDLAGWSTTNVTAEIIEKEKILVDSISIASTSDSITSKNGSVTLTANVLPANADNKGVLWEVTTNTHLATIDQNGILTATGVDNGTVLVRATAKDGSGKSATKGIVIQNQIVGGQDPYVYNGSRSLRIIFRGRDGIGWNPQVGQWVAVAPNTNYTVSMWAKGDTTFNLKLMEGGNIWADIPTSGGVATPNLSEWTQFTWTFNSGSRTSVWVCIGANGVDGTVWFDDITLTPAGGSNILLNSGFENNFANWDRPAFGDKVRWFIHNAGYQIKYVTAVEVRSASAEITANRGQMQMTVRLTPTDADYYDDIVWEVEEYGGKATISPTGMLYAEGNGLVRVIATSTDLGAQGYKDITISGQTNETADDPYVRTGFRSLKLDYTKGAAIENGNNVQTHQTISVMPNTDYVFYAYGKRNPAYGGNLYMRVTNTGNIYGSIATNYFTAGTDWTLFQLPFNSGSNTSVDIGFAADPWAGLNLVYIDDVEVRKASDNQRISVVNAGFEDGMPPWVNEWYSGASIYEPRIWVESCTINAPYGTSVTEKDGWLLFTAACLPDKAQDKSCDWTVSDTGIATINSSGYLVAKADGTVTVRATPKYAIDDTVYDEITVTITGQTIYGVTQINVTSESDVITVKGGMMQMYAEVLPADAENKAISWWSSNDLVATVSATGYVTAKGDGEVYIYAMAKDGSGTEGCKMITVSGQTAGQTAGTTYYISVTGNDLNSGTSPSDPWKTIDRANNMNYLPGDSILFECGGVWIGQFWLRGSGTEGNPITVGSYGSGMRPIINGSGYEQAILIYGSEWVTVEGLEIMNDASQPYTLDTPPIKFDPNADPADDPRVRSGNGSLRLYAKEAWARFTQFVNVEPYTEYHFGVWARSFEGTQGNNSIVLGGMKSNDLNQWVQMYELNQRFTNGTDWTYGEITFTTDNTTRIAVQIIDYRADANSIIYYDDARLYKASTPGINLLQDPGFEQQGTNAWGSVDNNNFQWIKRGVQDYPPVKVKEDVDTAAIQAGIKTGNSSLAKNATSAFSWIRSSFESIHVEPGAEYTVTIEAKGSGGVNVYGCAPAGGMGEPWGETPATMFQINTTDWTNYSFDTRFIGDERNLNSQGHQYEYINLAMQGAGAGYTGNPLFIDSITLTNKSTGEVIFYDNNFRGWSGDGFDSGLFYINELPYSSPNIHSGGMSWYCSAGGSGNETVSEDFAVTPGAPYEVSFWTKGSGGVKINGGATIAISSGEYWEQHTVTVTWPGSMGSLHVADAIAGDGFFIDDFVVTKVSDGTVAYTTAIQYDPWNGVFVYENWTWAHLANWFIYQTPGSEMYDQSKERHRRGIGIFATRNDMEGIVIRDLVIHDVVGYTIRALCWWSASIYVSGQGTFKNMLMEDIYVHDSMNLAYVNNNTYDHNTGMVIRNCVSTRAGAVDYGHGKDSVLEYCAFYDMGYNPYAYWGIATGGTVQWACYGATVQFCEFGRIRPGGDGMAIDIEMADGVTVIQHNYIHDAGGAIYMGGGYYDAAIFRYNIFVNNRSNGGPHATICSGRPYSYWYNNIFYSEYTGPHDGLSFSNDFFGVGTQTGPSNPTYFENNIFMTAKHINFPQDEGAGLMCSNNLYCYPGAAPGDTNDQHGIYMDWSGRYTVLKDPGGFKYNLLGDGGPLATAEDFHAVMLDKLSGYQLAEGSPAISAGKAVTLDEILAKCPYILDTRRQYDGQNFNGTTHDPVEIAEQHERNLFITQRNMNIDFWDNEIPENGPWSIGAHQYGGEPLPVVDVTGVTLDRSALTLEIDDFTKLNAVVEPANATNKRVTWSSSNDAVATVNSDGVVTAVAAGTAVITVKTQDGGHEAYCAVTVKAAAGEVILDELIALLEAAEGYYADAANYTADTVSALRIAMDAGYAVVDAEGPTQNDVEQAVNDLHAAIDGLALRVVFTCTVKSMLAKIAKLQKIPYQWNGVGSLDFATSNAAVCGVTPDGTLVPLKAGIAVITITVSNGDKYVFAVTVSA